MVCLAKNVLVKGTRSRMGLLSAAAHQLVNLKLLDVFLPLRLPLRVSSMWDQRVVLE